MIARLLTSIFDPVASSLPAPERQVMSLATDSRRVVEADGTLFFAIRTRRNDGAVYVPELYRRGVRDFVVTEGVSAELRQTMESYADANIWWVRDAVDALQRLAAYHRRQFKMPVIGITGSNGKTVVKDWLLQLLAPDHRPVVSPRSYNSQIGVPLSVWQMEAFHDIAVFEAGISRPGEMQRLQAVIDPTIGILTHLGAAHDENFVSREEKLREKLQLFTRCDYLIYCSDDAAVRNGIAACATLDRTQCIAWGTQPSNDLQLVNRRVEEGVARLTLCWHHDSRFGVVIPFVDRAASENVMHCIALMLHLGYSPAVVAERCGRLKRLATQLNLDEAVNDCLMVNDSYCCDLNSLAASLDFLQQESPYHERTLIVSDFPQVDCHDDAWCARVVELARWAGVDQLIGIGPEMVAHRHLFESYGGQCYASTDDYLQAVDLSCFNHRSILLKGSPEYHFERIAKRLRRRSHETELQVNLSALVHNLNYYRSRIAPKTKLMAMVKAASYGAGKAEVARVLEYNRVDYLTVAYIDEGVDLRRSGIVLPIMVMNPEPAGFDDMIQFRLEPDIYSLRLFDTFADAARERSQNNAPFPIHVEFDTGMHRLGLEGKDIPEMVQRLLQPDCPLQLVSLFSHLACSEDAAMDDFTRRQIAQFRAWSGQVKALMHRDDICCHILNSSGITRFPEAQMDMVRLGIGLYGVAPEPDVQACLQPVSRLVTRISQLKDIPQGDSVGYNCRWRAERPSRIAILSIGYADGLSRHLGNGNGHVMVCGKQAPIIGSICMDMCFVDVTDISCNEGDEVVLFGDSALLHQMAAAADTITYEILTAVSPRVKRVYYQE